MFRLLWLLALLSVVPAAPTADSEMSPYAYIAVANTGFAGRHFFKMSPDPAHPTDRDYGFGFAYKAGELQDSELLWRTEGWYAFQVLLSGDGRYLIRLGNSPRGRVPAADHLAVAFYDRGVLLKSYSTVDLIHDVSRVTASVSHYSFLAGDPPALSTDYGSTEFTLTSVDRVRYTFDFATGEILKQEQLP